MGNLFFILKFNRKNFDNDILEQISFNFFKRCKSMKIFIKILEIKQYPS